MPAIVRPSGVWVGCYPIVEANQKAGIGGLICAILNLIAKFGGDGSTINVSGSGCIG